MEFKYQLKKHIKYSIIPLAISTIVLSLLSNNSWIFITLVLAFGPLGLYAVDNIAVLIILVIVRALFVYIIAFIGSKSDIKSTIVTIVHIILISLGLLVGFVILASISLH